MYGTNPQQHFRSWLLVILLLLLSGLFAPAVRAEAASTKAAPANAQLLFGGSRATQCVGAAPMRQQGYVSVGGIEQWVSLNSSDCTLPVILFLHGGPANPISPFADAIYAGWERQFTLVQWDQRASGKTWLRNQPVPGERLTLAQMTQDGLALVQYLQQILGNRPLILMGSSWGSALGIKMVQQQPDWFAAYVGSSQLVSGPQNSLASYQAVLKLATAAQDQATLAQLGKLGPPPYAKPNGILRRLSRQYEAKFATPAPAHWWQAAAEFALEQHAAAYEAAEEYSFLQFMGFDAETGNTKGGMYHDIELQRDAKVLKVPVYFIQGEADLVTVPAVTAAYVNAIKAPHKELIMVAKAGHGPNAASIAAEWQTVQRIRAQLSGK
ncbi:MAG: alpha/beta hydrolase [Rheinheimera sp.]|nr:alpha/beta hydrolase [Rheinheimera sp.]